MTAHKTISLKSTPSTDTELSIMNVSPSSSSNSTASSSSPTSTSSNSTNESIPPLTNRNDESDDENSDVEESFAPPPKLTRKSYTIEFKRDTIKKIDAYVSANPGSKPSNAIAKLHLKIPSFYYKKWKGHVAKGDALALSCDPTAMNVTSKTRKLHPGRKSSLDNIVGSLQHKVFEKRERGLRVSIRSVTHDASMLSADFKKKSITAKISAIKRLIKTRLGLSQRVSTHVAQKCPKETLLASRFHDHGTSTCCQHASKHCR
jgi:hypothetical protein